MKDAHVVKEYNDILMDSFLIEDKEQVDILMDNSLIEDKKMKDEQVVKEYVDALMDISLIEDKKLRKEEFEGLVNDIIHYEFNRILHKLKEIDYPTLLDVEEDE